MQRTCPDCHGNKKVTVNDWMFGRMTVDCSTCHGQGFVTGKRPGKRSYSHQKTKRAKTPSYIKARREEAKREKNEREKMKAYLGDDWKTKHKWEGKLIHTH